MNDLMITVEQCREALLLTAIEEWHRQVDASKDDPRITRYFADIGWQWHLDQHSEGVFSEAVRRSGPNLEYCGAFVAWCGLHLGDYLVPGQCLPYRLRPEIAELVLPSTYRANTPDLWSRAGVDPPAQVPHEQIERGDIITVKTSAGKAYGDHFAIVVQNDQGTLFTVEANATGWFPDTSEGRGVVRRSRKLEDVRRVYRLELHHFENAITGEVLQEVGDA